MARQTQMISEALHIGFSTHAGWNRTRRVDHLGAKPSDVHNRHKDRKVIVHTEHGVHGLSSLGHLARQVTKATQAVNSMFGMDNDFPIFMAVMDIAWFRPEVIDPASPVPTGMGAEPYMERLADHLGLPSHQKVAERMIAIIRSATF